MVKSNSDTGLEPEPCRSNLRLSKKSCTCRALLKIHEAYPCLYVLGFVSSAADMLTVRGPFLLTTLVFSSMLNSLVYRPFRRMLVYASAFWIGRSYCKSISCRKNKLVLNPKFAFHPSACGVKYVILVCCFTVTLLVCAFDICFCEVCF